MQTDRTILAIRRKVLVQSVPKTLLETLLPPPKPGSTPESKQMIVERVLNAWTSTMHIRLLNFYATELIENGTIDKIKRRVPTLAEQIELTGK
jgi:hypothetical protein